MTKKASALKGYDNIFSTRLRKLMEDNKITQQTLADKTGCSRQAISQYMDGTSAPNVDKLISIAKFFDVSTDYLLGLAQEPTTNMELNSICEYTGLRKNTIETLHNIYNNDILCTLNHLIEDMGYKKEGEFLTVNESSILNAICDYYLCEKTAEEQFVTYTSTGKIFDEKDIEAVNEEINSVMYRNNIKKTVISKRIKSLDLLDNYFLNNIIDLIKVSKNKIKGDENGND